MSKFYRPELGNKYFAFNSLLIDIERLIQLKKVNFINWIQIRKLNKKSSVELIFMFKKRV